MRAGELGDQVRAVLRSVMLLAAALAAIHDQRHAVSSPRSGCGGRSAGVIGAVGTSCWHAC
jgi:hypothetical protein